MILERNNNEILVRLPSSIDTSELQDVLDFLKYQENATHAKTAQSDVDKLANEVNKSMWETFKSERGF